MLTETEITLVFPMGAGPFRQSPSLFIYRQILRLIHQISCMSPQSRCKECPLHSDCRYYWITGSHFNGYSGLICPSSPFEKRKFAPREELTIRLYWIGTAGDFSPMADAAVSRMEQNIMGSFFYLKSIPHRVLKEDTQTVRQIRFTGPVQTQMEQDNPTVLFEQMNAYYRQWYQSSFLIPSSVPSTEDALSTDQNKEIKPGSFQPAWNPGIFVEGAPVSLGTKKLTAKGHVGTLFFPEEQIISSFWSLIGLGKTNCIGGGQFETDHSI